MVEKIVSADNELTQPRRATILIISTETFRTSVSGPPSSQHPLLHRINQPERVIQLPYHVLTPVIRVFLTDISWRNEC